MTRTPGTEKNKREQPHNTLIWPLRPEYLCPSRREHRMQLPYILGYKTLWHQLHPKLTGMGLETGLWLSLVTWASLHQPLFTVCSVQYVGNYDNLQPKTLNNCWCYSGSLGYRTYWFLYQLNSLGRTQPCCHHGVGDYSNTQANTVQPCAPSLLGPHSAHAGEVSCPRTQHRTAAAETHTQDLSVQSRRSVTVPWCPACIWSIKFRCRDTEGGHCQADCHPQWFSYVPFNVSEMAPLFTWSREPQEIHSLHYWRVRIKPPHAYPTHNGDWSWGHRVTGKDATTALLLPSVPSHPLKLLKTHLTFSKVPFNWFVWPTWHPSQASSLKPNLHVIF